MSIFKKFSQKNLFEIVETFMKRTPAPPRKIKTLLIEYVPYATWIGCAAHVFYAYHLGMKLLELQAGQTINLPLSPINIILTIVVNLLMGVLYILAFKPLTLCKKSGWMMMFNVSIMYVLIAITTLNAIYVVLPFCIWYLLVHLKNEYA